MKYFLMKYTLTINLDGICDALVKISLPPVVSDGQTAVLRVCDLMPPEYLCAHEQIVITISWFW